MNGAKTRNGVGIAISLVLRVGITLLMIAVPLVGVWVASSLAAYFNGPVWLVCLAGLLLFPVLPLLWDAVAMWRRRRQKKRESRLVLTPWDRLVLRTLALNAVFLTVLVWRAPEQAFEATTTRGDWMLDGVEHPAAARARGWILEAADGLHWLYTSAHDNEFADLIEADAKPTQRPDVSARSDNAWADPWARSVEDEVDGELEDEAEVETGKTSRTWPFADEVHPAIAAMPEHVRGSIEQVGRYIVEHESDPYLRVKAIHDFVALHVAYDAASYRAGRYPPQDAQTVFETRLSVCAGYANLTKAIADVTRDEVVIVVGEARARGGELSGEGHAWNAARIEGLWYLFDTTWDSGYVEGDRFVAEYRTSYFLPPPTVMGITHFPEDPDWQLRVEPISRGEFFRQPMMRPDFFAQGFTLENPRRSQITVDRQVDIFLGNERNRHVLATFQQDRDAQDRECEVTPGRRIAIRCALSGAGTYHIKLFWSPQEYGTYAFLGEIVAHARG